MNKKEESKKDLRNFSYIWGIIFIIIWISHKNSFLLFLSFAFFIVGTFKPAVLKYFYKIWIKVGDFIGGVVSKIILFILFYFVFTPVSIMLKIFKKDLLDKKIDKNKKTYWIDRKEQPRSMKNQF